MKITNKEMTELEKISYDIASYVTHDHNKHDIRSLREFIENRIRESELNKTNDIHSVSHCPLCGSDDLFQYKLQHIHCQKCHESFNKGCD
jgi:transposase-like protein